MASAPATVELTDRSTNAVKIATAKLAKQLWRTGLGQAIHLERRSNNRRNETNDCTLDLSRISAGKDMSPKAYECKATVEDEVDNRTNYDLLQRRVRDRCQAPKRH